MCNLIFNNFCGTFVSQLSAFQAYRTRVDYGDAVIIKTTMSLLRYYFCIILNWRLVRDLKASSYQLLEILNI